MKKKISGCVGVYIQYNHYEDVELNKLHFLT